MPGRFFCGAFLNPLNAVRFPSLFRPVSKRFQNRRRTGINNNLLPVIFTRLMALPFIQYLTDAQRNIGTGSINYNKPLIKFNHHPLMGTERLKKVLSIPPLPLSFSKTFHVRFSLLRCRKKGKSGPEVWRKNWVLEGKARNRLAFGKVGQPPRARGRQSLRTHASGLRMCLAVKSRETAAITGAGTKNQPVFNTEPLKNLT